jgi:3',5'-cyclic AMP phosphodiesterase CpdA
MKIVHISDPHFGCDANPFSEEEMIDILSSALSPSNGVNYFIITGDITYRGSGAGYDVARRVLGETLKKTHFDQKGIIACPGNHDITTKQFTPFNEFMNFLRKDNLFNFELTRTCQYQVTSQMFCLSINSSYTLDRRTVLVDIDNIRKTIESNISNVHDPECRVAILHHHIINQYQKDNSVLKNAYELIKTLDEYGFNLILHGHQHSLMSLKLGSTPILNLAVGSFNFHDSGFANGINTYELQNSVLRVTRYTFSKDQKKHGRIIPVVLGATEEYPA